MKVGMVICANNALLNLKDRSKSNWIDARKLAALLAFPYADWKRRLQRRGAVSTRRSKMHVFANGLVVLLRSLPSFSMSFVDRRPAS